MKKEQTRFSIQLLNLRKSKNMSGSQFAKMLEIPQTTYSSYEAGKVEPPLSLLIRIAQLLNVSIDHLLGLSETQHDRVVQSTVNGHNVNGSGNVVSSAPADADEIASLKARIAELEFKLEYATELIKNLKK